MVQGAVGAGGAQAGAEPAMGQELVEGGDQALVLQDLGGDAAHDGPQGGQGGGGVGAGRAHGLGQIPRVPAVAQPQFEGGEVEADGGQVLLGAVVELALDPAPLPGEGVEEDVAGAGQGGRPLVGRVGQDRRPGADPGQQPGR